MDQMDKERETGGTESEPRSAHTEPGAGSAKTESERAESQREFEGKLDAYADKISKAVGDGVKRLEEVFERGKENVETDRPEGGVQGLKGSPRSGIVLIGIGIVWLLYIAGLFEHVIFPILLIVLGIYFVIRNR